MLQPVPHALGAEIGLLHHRPVRLRAASDISAACRRRWRVPRSDSAWSRPAPRIWSASPVPGAGRRPAACGCGGIAATGCGSAAMAAERLATGGTGAGIGERPGASAGAAAIGSSTRRRAASAGWAVGRGRPRPGAAASDRAVRTDDQRFHAAGAAIWILHRGNRQAPPSEPRRQASLPSARHRASPAWQAPLAAARCAPPQADLRSGAARISTCFCWEILCHLDPLEPA